MTSAGLPHSGIDGALPACGPPSLFAACHALHRPVSPRHPPHTGSCLGETASRPRPCPAAAREPPLATARHHVSLLTRRPGRVRNQNAAYSAFACCEGPHIDCIPSSPVNEPANDGADVPTTNVAARAAWCAGPYTRRSLAVGLSGFEPETSALSGQRSNHLS